MKTAIIGALLVLTTLVSGCGAMRLAYDRAPDVVYWWVDGYVDFDDAQSERASVALDRYFDWHRRTQLPDYAALLGRASRQVGGAEPATGAVMCRWADEVGARIPALVEQALPMVAGLATTLTPEQLRHVERKYEKTNAKYRDEYLQPDPADRLDAAVERVVDRAESVYGGLDDTQTALVRRLVGASPFDPAVWLAERQQRQRELLAALRRLQAASAPPAEVQATLRTLVARMQVSPREPYRRYAERLRAYNCELAAQLHNATTPKQRRKAAERLDGWANDFRALTAARAASAP